MFGNFLTVTLRQLWRNRLTTALNVLGLAIGISAAWIMYQYVAFEFSYDAQHPQRDRIYRVSSSFILDGKEAGNTGIPRPLPAAAASVAGVELAVPVFETGLSSVQAGGPASGNPRFEDIRNCILTDDRYFQLFPYRWLAGNPVGALAQPDQVVLTRERAAKYFPGVAPEYLPGQILTYNDTIPMRISGIVEDLAYPSSLIGREFRSNAGKKYSEKYWTGVNSGDQLFLLLAENADPGAVQTQINRISEENSREKLMQRKITRTHVLQPLSGIHFATEYGGSARTANKKVLFALAGVAGFLLLLACINYVNLATARIPQRAREIGIRKTLGSNRSNMLLHFLGETALVATASVLLAALLTKVFFNTFGDLLPEEVLKYVRYDQTVFFLAGLVLVVSLLAGLYPGWLITRAQPVRVLRGQVDAGPSSGRITVRQGLIVFQFAVAQLFIVGALIIGQQLHFMLNTDLGFNREAVVVFDIPWKLMDQPAYKDKHFTLLEELKKLPEVEKAALGDPLLSRSYSSNVHSYRNEKGEEVKRNLYRKWVDPDMIQLYELPLLAGRNLLPSDTMREYLINEAAVQAFGLGSPQEAIGKVLQEEEGQPIPIVGVVSDFHALSFAEKIEPVMLSTDRGNLSTINVKLASREPADWKNALAAVEAQWKQFYPSEPFEYSFYDETLAEMYKAQTDLSRIINLATAVALLISCLGLFGLATFMAYRRTKEIGIRKVLGASVAAITGLLAKDFLKLVLIAILLASPAAWWAMNKWLENFAYRIELQWWMFAGAGLAAIGIAFLTVSFQSIKAALTDPVKSLRSE